jgi:hypothetical protein
MSLRTFVEPPEILTGSPTLHINCSSSSGIGYSVLSALAGSRLTARRKGKNAASSAMRHRRIPAAAKTATRCDSEEETADGARGNECCDGAYGDAGEDDPDDLALPFADFSSEEWARNRGRVSVSGRSPGTSQMASACKGDVYPFFDIHKHLCILSLSCRQRCPWGLSGEK